MKFWFVSDYHFGHANIIAYCNRPFKDLEQMNKVLIRNHNSRVKPEDTVFFLGDFCFKNTKGGKEGEGELNNADHYLKQLNGKFVFIRGNHDNNNSMRTVIKGAIIEIGGKTMYLVHDPADFDPAFEVNIVGHVHDAWKSKMVGKIPVVNVGCDVWNFMPVELNELLTEIDRIQRG